MGTHKSPACWKWNLKVCFSRGRAISFLPWSINELSILLLKCEATRENFEKFFINAKHTEKLAKMFQVGAINFTPCFLLSPFCALNSKWKTFFLPFDIRYFLHKSPINLRHKSRSKSGKDSALAIKLNFPNKNVRLQNWDSNFWHSEFRKWSKFCRFALSRSICHQWKSSSS